MSKAIILYDILLEQGIKKDRAEKAVSAFITRDEVPQRGQGQRPNSFRVGSSMSTIRTGNRSTDLGNS